MRVAMPILEYPPILGGAQRQLASLGPLLAERGIDAHVLTREVPGEAREERVDGMTVHRLPTGSWSALSGPRYVAAAVREIGALEPDVVHAFSLFSPTLIAVRARRRYGIPAIVKVLRGGEMGERARILRKPLASLRIAQMRRWIDRFAVISHEIDADLAALGIRDEQRVWLPNGVELDRFRPADAEERRALRVRLGFGEGATVLYCGRLVPEKNLDLLIEAWSSVRNRFPTAELCLVGEGPEEDRLRSLAAAEASGVRFAGGQLDVTPWLQASDVFVLPSRTEGLSNAMLEAMSVGLPVVVTRVGGAEDVVDDGQNGVLVAPGSVAELEQALADCLADGDRRISLGQGARKTIFDHYSLERTADRWVEAYRGLAQRSGRRDR
jgi:glycosyltransferase involved in cell wall biosynthesis